VAGGYPAGEKYIGGIDGGGFGRIISHRPLRRQAREAFHENPQARGLVTRYADTVADQGLRPESNPIPEILGISPEEAEEVGEQLDTRFELWAMNKKQHRANQMHFYQSQYLYQIQQHRDNDQFIRLFYASDSDLISSLQFEFIDPDQIDGLGFTTTFGSQFPMDGIERDERGREVAYNVRVQKQLGAIDLVKIPRVGPKSKRLFMLHGFTQEYAGQGRGYSRLGFALQDFADLTNLSIAHINKAIIHAGMAGAVVPSDVEDSSNPYEGVLTEFGTGPAAEKFGANPEVEGSPSIDNETPDLRCYDIPEASKRVPNIFFTNLKRGEDIKLFDMKAPADSYNQFVDAFTSYISAAFGMPLEVLLMKFGENFSASRGALLLFWQVAQIWRQEMAADYLNPVREMFIAVEISTGRIKLPGWSDPRLRAAWLSVNWIGSAPPDIDPSKTAKARETNLRLGISTGTREARALNGSVFKKNKSRLQTEYGQVPPFPGSKEPAPSNSNEDEPENEEDE